MITHKAFGILSWLGLAFIAGGSAKAQQLVSNGSFSATSDSAALANFVPNPWLKINGTPDLVNFSNTIEDVASPAVASDYLTPANSPGGGNFEALSSQFNTDSDVIAQNLSGLIIGQSYLLTFSAANLGLAIYGENISNNSAYFGDGSIQASIFGDGFETPVMAVSGAWTTYEFSFIATGTNAILFLGANATGVATTTFDASTYQNRRSDIAYLLIDDVSVMAVPEASGAILFGLAATVPLLRRRRF